MVYDLSSTGKGTRDCPRCRHTMERLRKRLAMPQNAGYVLDDEREGSACLTFLLFDWIGLLLMQLYRHTLVPLTSKLIGERRERRLQKILNEYPESLICPYCSHLIKLK